MNIHELSLTNFRSFTTVDAITFPPQALLVAAAPNATGKTNFLEAITLLLRGKSFRATTDECVRWGADHFLLRGVLNSLHGEARIAVRYHLPTRKLRIEEDGTPASPVTFFSRYPYVLFLPDDTFLFIRGPASRRTAINHILVSIPAYLSALVQYHRALKQRNALLKMAKSFADLAAWTDLLLEHSRTLWNYRDTFARFLNSHISDLYHTMSGENRTFVVSLATAATAENMRDVLERAFTYEQRYGYTLYGPHRDDIEITTDNRPIRAALSRGQMRSLIIAFKIAAHRFIKQTTKEEPIMLLDEVLSELDDSRQTTLLQNLPATQTLLTCTSLPRALRQRSDVHLLDLRSIAEPLPSVSPPSRPFTPEFTEEPSKEDLPLRVLVEK